MYTPHKGGAFGQHAWNEVYMGGAGWIPIDTTIGEADYVDSGHIRIGVSSHAAACVVDDLHDTQPSPILPESGVPEEDA